MGTSHRTIETPVYYFDQLSDEAKARARDWYREISQHDRWWDSVYEDAVQVASYIGIEISTRPKEDQPSIFFSGFCSQGDGACFEGDYAYKKGWHEALEDSAPEQGSDSNKELHRIAKALQAIQQAHFYKLSAKVKQSGRYMHSGCTDIEVIHDEDQYRDIGCAEGEVRQLLRDFMDWIYDRLEDAYEWTNSDEVVEENIKANEHEFDATGSRV